MSIKDLYPGWNQIDLHSHGREDLPKDGKEKINNYTHQKFYNVVKDQKVDLKAVTNHNRFDYVEHIKYAIICSLLNVEYIPGIELDCCFNTRSFHAVILFGPDTDLFNFSVQLKAITDERKRNNKEIVFTKEEFGELFSSMNFIFIPHAIKKEGIMNSQNSDASDIENIEWVISTIKNGLSMPILLENTKDYHIYSVEERINKLISSNQCPVEVPCIVNSDYIFDNDEERKKIIESKPKYCIYSKPTYRGLEIAIRNYKTRFSTIDNLIKRSRYIKALSFNNLDNDDFKLEKTINLSTGLNVIIGNSGSGKTLLLNEIYYKATGKNLDVSTNKTKNNNDDLYKNKIKGKNLFEISYDNNDNIKIVEIPKIYNRILKLSNSDNLGKDFGINGNQSYEIHLNKYKTLLSEFENKCVALNDLTNKGSTSLTTLFNSIEFVISNMKSQSFFNLEKTLYKSTEKKNIEKKSKSIKELIEKKENIIEYLDNVSFYLEKKDKKIVEEIKEKYLIIINKLIEMNKSLEHEVDMHSINEKIYFHINNSIELATKELGQKEKNVSLHKEIILNETNNLVSYIIDYITNEIDTNKLDYKYPFEEIKKEIEINNKNDYAREVISIKESDLNNVDLSNSELINNENIKTKLKNKTINFLNNNSIKSSIKELLSMNIKLSEKIITYVPVDLELKIEGIWKKEHQINPGDLAKTYMNYYFTNLIKQENPNVILIDQPENDVDKTFLTETLSKFIKDYKQTIQFIITTHDPILAINSDVNLIILAKLNDKNQITYNSYYLEDIDYDTLSYTGSNIISKILDGGKSNITLRYQVYGGEIND